MQGDIPLRESFRIQLDVVSALILRDLKTRFEGGLPSFLIAILWPLGHTVIIVTAYSVAGARDLLGSDALVFISIGVLQFILSMYVMRWIAVALSGSKPLLSLPRVKALDIILARIVVEVNVAFAVAFSMVAILLMLGSEFNPFDPLSFLACCGASVLLGISIGIPAAVIVGIKQGFAVVIILLMVLAYIASGVLFLPGNLPETFREIAAWSPLLHAVEWAREAYYPDYHSLVLDKGYLLAWGVAGVVIGLLMERFVRR